MGDKCLRQIIDSRILLSDLKVMAVEGEIHSDEEALLRPLSIPP